MSMRKVFLSLVSVIGGEAAVRVANFVALLFIARAFGATTLGAYAVSLAAVTVVVMFADAGLQTAAITQLSTEGVNRNEIFGRLTLCKTILLAAVLVMVAPAIRLTTPGPLLLAIGICVSARAILQSYSQLQLAVLKSVFKANWIGIIQALHSTILFVGMWLTYRQGWNIFALLGWLTFSQFVELLLGTAVLYRSGFRPLWPARLAFWTTVRIAAPLGIAYGLANLIIRLDTIVLSGFVSLADLGSFSATNSLLLIVYVCAWLSGSILLPDMVRLSSDAESLKAYANQWVRWVILVTLPGAPLASLVAPKAVALLYGASFASGGALGSVMVMACPFIFLNSIYTAYAIATNNRAILLGIYGGTTLATLALDFFLGRTFGSMGVASAIVAREAGMLLGFWLLTSRVSAPAAELELRPSSGGQ